jgi:hypothetical protein
MDWFTHILAFLCLLALFHILTAMEEFAIEALKSAARWLNKTNRPSYARLEEGEYK